MNNKLIILMSILATACQPQVTEKKAGKISTDKALTNSQTPNQLGANTSGTPSSSGNQPARTFIPLDEAITAYDIKVVRTPTSAEIEAARLNPVTIPTQGEGSFLRVTQLQKGKLKAEMDFSNNTVFVKSFSDSEIFSFNIGINQKSECRTSRSDIDFKDMSQAYHTISDTILIPLRHMKVSLTRDDFDKPGTIYYVKCQEPISKEITGFSIDFRIFFPQSVDSSGFNKPVTNEVKAYFERKPVNFVNARKTESLYPPYEGLKDAFKIGSLPVEMYIDTVENANCSYSLGIQATYYGMNLPSNYIAMLNKNGNLKRHYFYFTEKLADNSKASTISTPIYISCLREGEKYRSGSYHYVTIKVK